MSGVPNLRALITKVVEDPVLWRRIAQTVLAEWKQRAAQLPVPARFIRAYIRCLHIVSSDNRRATVAFDTSKAPTRFDAMLAMAVENGVRSGGIDMKPWFLAKRAVTNVPLIHTGKAIASYKPTGSNTITAIGRALKNLEEGARHPTGTVERIRSKGIHSSETNYRGSGQSYNQVVIAYNNFERKTMPRYAHATDPLAQAIRQSAPFRTATRSYGKAGSIVTFRRISAQSDPRSWFWMRKGMKGHHLATKMRVAARQIAAAILQQGR